MQYPLVYFAVVIFLVAANGYFVAAEFALVSVRRSRVVTLVESGDRRAPLLLELLDDLNSFISATQLGITMASLALGWVGEPAFARLLELPLRGHVPDALRHTIAFVLAFIAITFLHIVLGELAPKTLALERTERVALAVARSLRIFHTVFRWPIMLLDRAGRLTVRTLGLKLSSDNSEVYSVEELRQIIDVSHSSGEMEADEQRLLHRVFEFSDSEVRDVMVPRNDVSALPITATFEDTWKTFSDCGYSRIPVYREHLDDIAGIVVRRDLEPFLSGDVSNNFSLVELLHPSRFIPASAQLSVALKQMQASRAHMLFVVDEYGGLEGIVTLEDILEEIVGEIEDEFDDDAPLAIVEENGGFLLDGMLTVREVNHRLGLQLPEDEPYTTIAGFLLAQAGHLLKQGESVFYNQICFTVESVDRRRIRRIRLIVESSTV
ncbi:MAG TPA: HlyC/CorC family transporter [Desulfuromonadales bacterium]|nr:HlyC/CorC family transporter [Desulfuromonadales bacterium]